MKRNIYIASSVLGALALLSSASIAFAEGGGVGLSGTVHTQINLGSGGTNAHVDTQTRTDTGESDRGDVEEQHSAVVSASTTHQEKQDVEENDGDTDNDGSDADEQHGSVVASIVAHLHLIADRENERGVGEEVRTVAKEEASSSVASTEAMHELNSEGFLKKLFLGPNYKNIGQLRSTISVTENHIERLQHVLANTTDAHVRADLIAQIAALQGLASSTEVYVQAHERVFSVFGWFFRLLSND